MSVSAAFQNAQAGLSVALRRADIVSTNVANALTPGYVRRDLSVSERTNGAGGAGPKVDGVIRAGDPALTRERRLAEGASERERTIAEAHQAFNRALGEPDDEFSLSGKHQQLETALRQLATTPESAPNQRNALEAARTLVASFNDLGGRAQTVREEADAAIASDVRFVNDSLKQIDNLNRDITLAGKGGRDTSSLQDQRQALINDVAKVIPVREIPRDDGGVDLITQEGVFLIAGKSREIEFTPRGVITPDLSFNGGAGALSGITVAGVDITPGGTRPSQSIRGGSLAGHFAVRDEIAPSFTAQIDSLAADLVQRFESSDPTRAAGAPGFFTDAGAAYAPANEVGLAGRLALNPAVDPENGGALWRVRDGVGATTEGASGNAAVVNAFLGGLREARAQSAGAQLSGLKSAAQAVAGVVSVVGAERLTAEQRQTAAKARADTVIESEQTALGVDTDAELQKLIFIQQAYAANARVMQVASDLIDTLTRIGQ